MRQREAEQDTKRHEHLIAENGKQLGGALGVNMSEAAHHRQHGAEDEMAITPETETGGAGDRRSIQELEAAQIEM